MSALTAAAERSSAARTSWVSENRKPVIDDCLDAASAAAAAGVS
jgi:hypothetical protein